MTEIEATFLNADHDKVRGDLQKLRAKLVEPEHMLKRRLFDYPDLRLDKAATWLRLRTEPDGVHLALKRRRAETIDGMDETDITVSDFEKTSQLLESIGLIRKADQENKREKWLLDKCEVCLDTWPWIPPFVEIEGPDEQIVRATAEKLGFDWTNAMFDSVDAIYMKHFDVTRTEISKAKIEFSKTPDWLETKRKV